MTTTDMPKKIHEGKNVKRFRDMLGINQDVLADMLGKDWNQKKVSQLESTETIESDVLEQVAKVLKVPAEAIRNFDEEKAIQIINNTFNDNAMLHNLHSGYQVYQPTFNPLDKIVELYERLLAAEKEKKY